MDTSATAAWHHHLEQLAVPLWALDANHKPVKFGTGTLIEFEGRTILLTAAHVTDKLQQASWTVHLRYDEVTRESRLYAVGPLNFLYRACYPHTSADGFIDVTYAFVPADIHPRHQVIKDTGRVVHEDDRLISVTDLTDTPVVGSRYGFAGYTKPFTALKEGFLGGETRIEDGLSYVERRGDRHVFKLSGAHPGHDTYEGCSGTAICDENGDIVSLLLAGSIEAQELEGLAFDTLRPALLVACSRAS